MQEFWEFDIIQPLDEPSSLPYAEIIKDLVEKKAKDMGIYLSYYYKGEGGIVEEVEWADSLCFDSPNSGSFKIRYDIIYFNACLDIHTGNKNEMPIYFNFDKAQRKLKLNGPHWPEREPDDI